jgi:hypothetical protein
MGSKKLTRLQHNKNEHDKKRMHIKEEKKNCKKEIKLLEKIRDLPEELCLHIYMFVKNDIKFNLSFYKTLFTKYIYDYSNRNRTTPLSVVFKGYSNDFNYCTFNRTALLIKEILEKAPFEKLEKFILYGTPSKYFNNAFPLEPDIKRYFESNYKNKPDSSEEDMIYQRKNYVFEILDLLSYFSTRANEWHAMQCTFNNKFLTRLNFLNNVYNFEEYIKQSEESCRENEMIFKKIMLGILVHLSTF